MDRWRVRERIGEVRKRTDVPLHYEYRVGPFSLRIYQGNERMGIQK
jgi:hypothetical protein